MQQHNMAPWLYPVRLADYSFRMPMFPGGPVFTHRNANIFSQPPKLRDKLNVHYGLFIEMTPSFMGPKVTILDSLRFNFAFIEGP